MLLGEGGIFIGFLWVIDFGVGVIFLLFIVSNSSFLHYLNITNINIFKNFIPLFLIIFFASWSCFDQFYNAHINDSFPFFLLTWYNLWELYFSFETTDLNLLREIFFVNESWEFFLVNFVILYGLMGAIFFFFLSKRFMPLKKNWNSTNLVFSLVIRNQDMLKQQHTSSTVRHWEKTQKYNVFANVKS